MSLTSGKAACSGKERAIHNPLTDLLRSRLVGTHSISHSATLQPLQRITCFLMA